MPEQDVHGDFEADDVWQNLLMFKRTGNSVYREMAANWAEYYVKYYQSDLNSGGNPDGNESHVNCKRPANYPAHVSGSHIVTVTLSDFVTRKQLVGFCPKTSH